jgi:ABC-type branched-subunit amino acid transport system substrate-binding protein
MHSHRRSLIASGLAAIALGSDRHRRRRPKRYDTGASDTEIKIGHIVPYSGPASAYGTIGKAAAGYFQWVNDQGGINGRKVNFISLDDGYSPPKTVEMARRLVEQDEVLMLFAPLGTAQNTAIIKYMNAKKVPHLFLATGATKWGRRTRPRPGPWAGSRPTRPRARSMRSIC